MWVVTSLTTLSLPKLFKKKYNLSEKGAFFLKKFTLGGTFFFRVSFTLISDLWYVIA